MIEELDSTEYNMLKNLVKDGKVSFIVPIDNIEHNIYLICFNKYLLLKLVEDHTEKFKKTYAIKIMGYWNFKFYVLTENALKMFSTDTNTIN